MSINKLITIKDAINDAFEDIGIDTTFQMPIFMRWATRAEKEIHSYYGWVKKHKVLTFTGCTVKLPIDAMRVQYVLMGDHGCECTDLISSVSRWASSSVSVANTTVSQNEVFLVIDKADDSFGCSGIYYEIQDNSLVFRNNYEEQQVTIQYLGLNEDCDGFLMVGENHIDAINYYIKYRYATRSRFSPVKMELGDVMYFKKEWERLCKEARADDAIPSEPERAAIVAMLHDPYVGWGLNVGMTSNNDLDNGTY